MLAPPGTVRREASVQLIEKFPAVYSCLSFPVCEMGSSLSSASLLNEGWVLSRSEGANMRGECPVCHVLGSGLYRLREDLCLPGSYGH